MSLINCEILRQLKPAFKRTGIKINQKKDCRNEIDTQIT